MTTETKPLAKSLHTIRVIVNVARYVKRIDYAKSLSECIRDAIAILGHQGAEDPYCLAEKALGQLALELVRDSLAKHPAMDVAHTSTEG